MSPVPWVTVAPELVEKIVAVMLSRENGRAQRIRPSRGDGGLDVVVPSGANLPGPVVDYQVKYFATNLTAHQKTQIVHSLLSARDTHVDPASSFTIDRWLLTMPLDQTREQSEWLARLALTYEIPFPVEWRGLSFLDGLAAKYQDVVDYYLADGRSRLETAIKDLRGLVGLADGSDPGHLLLPADVHEPSASCSSHSTKTTRTTCTSTRSPPSRHRRSSDQAWSRASAAQVTAHASPCTSLPATS